METTYDGLAAIGKAKASASLIWTHLICVPIAGVGLYLFFRKQVFSAQVTGVVSTEPRCGTTPDDDTKCFIDIAFRLPGDAADRTIQRMVTRTTVTETTSDGTVVIHVMPLDYVNGQSVTLYYDPAQPMETASLYNNDDDWAPVGIFLVVVASIFLIISWIKYALTREFTALAALDGASEVGHTRHHHDHVSVSSPSSSSTHVVHVHHRHPTNKVVHVNHAPSAPTKTIHINHSVKPHRVIRINHPSPPSSVFHRNQHKAPSIAKVVRKVYHNRHK